MATMASCKLKGMCEEERYLVTLEDTHILLSVTLDRAGAPGYSHTFSIIIACKIMCKHIRVNTAKHSRLVRTLRVRCPCLASRTMCQNLLFQAQQLNLHISQLS